MGSALVSVRGLSVGYGTSQIVSDISFDVHAGEILLLIGPNGGGKSTLLRTILGAIPALKGEVRLGDELVSNLAANDIAHRLAFIPQDEESPFDFTAREMVTMGRLVHAFGWVESAEDRSIVCEAMQSNDCSQFADRPISTLSGGERQRVLLSRAVAQQSPLLLLDEPNAHLDVRYQLEMERFLQHMLQKGHGVIAAVHDLNMALRLGAHSILIAHGSASDPIALGKLVESGALEAAYGVPFSIGTVDSVPVIKAG